MSSDAPTIVGGGHEVVCSLRGMLIKLVLMDVMLTYMYAFSVQYRFVTYMIGNSILNISQHA